jgi:subtilisin family serine protease
VLATGTGDIPSFYTNFGRSVISVAGPGGNADLENLVFSLWPWGVHYASFVWSYCAKHTAATDADDNPIFDPTGRPLLGGCETGGFLTGMLGTSQATPHVAGLAALIMADQGVDAFKAKQLLIKSADDLGQPGTDPYFGHGRINVARAVGLE